VVWSEKPPRSSFPKEESGREICMSKSGNETNKLDWLMTEEREREDVVGFR
jgi:hypothetical protein